MIGAPELSNPDIAQPNKEREILKNEPRETNINQWYWIFLTFSLLNFIFLG